MTVDKGKGEIPGQESFTFPPSEKPNVTKLIEEAQGLGILSETSQIELPQGATNKIDMGEGFSLRRSALQSSRTGSDRREDGAPAPRACARRVRR